MPHMSDVNKALVTRWFDEVWNQQRVDTILELMAADCLTTVQGLDDPLTRDAFVDYQRAFLSAVPDLISELILVVAEGTTVVANWRARGTHTGPGLGIPPSSRRVDFSGMSVFEMSRGVIICGRDTWNRGEMIASLLQVRIDEICSHSSLTYREAQVALLMTERYPHGEIAEQLRIQANTARRHCERVLAKLGISRKQDVAKALGKIQGSALARHGKDVVEEETVRS